MSTVSAVVSTRNRPEHIVPCVDTILDNEMLSELLVVDQSDGAATKQALSPVRDPRLRYVQTPTRGVTSGRNIGIELSRGEIIAFTDDDCRVPRDWIARMVQVFESDPDVAVVCGRVNVPDEIRAAGHTEGFEPREREWKGRYPPYGRDWGITANMGLRRTALARIGMFDPMLGAGAPLRSGGEPDLIFRAIRSGYTIINATEVVVDHLGVRAPGADSRKLILGYGVGTGAALFKHARLGDPVGATVYARYLGRIVTHVCGNILSGRRPTGIGYLQAFVSGSLASFRYRIDPELRRYVYRRGGT